jgi:hypothetical protein
MRGKVIDLEEFVRQSNMIEGEPTEPGHPLFDDHLAIAKRVLVDPYHFATRPLYIHGQLMASQPQKFPGEMRQCRIYVGGNEKVPPTFVRLEMNVWLDMATAGLHAGMKPRGREKWCWEMHHRFEWIHPFIDGNGRTGRLLLNALRCCSGLEWHTVQYKDRFAYYRSIEEWEHEHE